ncbi:hypothetical protein D3C72_1096870 [compost metagenome]
MLASGAGGGVLAQHADDVGADAAQIHAQVLQHAHRYALALTDEAQEQVLGADVVVAQLTGLVPGQFQHALGTRGEGNLHRHEAGPAADDLLDLDARVFQADAQALERLGSNTGAFANQSQQNLLGANEVVAKPPRFFLRQHDDLDGFFCESLKHGAPLILQRIVVPVPGPRAPEWSLARHWANRL